MDERARTEADQSQAVKTLPLELESKGFGYRQVSRVGNVAVYSQHQGGLSGGIIAYEVIIIQWHDTYSIAGHEIQAGESYPPTSSWGRLGWTISRQEKDAKQKALDKMSQVVQAQST